MIKKSCKYIKMALLTNLILVGGYLSASPEQNRVDAVHREDQRLEDKRLDSARVDQQVQDQQLQQQRLEQSLQNRRQDDRRLDNARWDRQHGR